MTTSENISPLNTASTARFDRLTELLTSTPVAPRVQQVQQRLRANRPYNAMLALVLHSCARFEQGLPLSDLESKMLLAVRRCNSEEELKQFGLIYQQLSAEQRAAVFPDRFASLPITQSYSQADFSEDLKTLVPQLLKQPNVRTVDVSQLDVDGRLPDDAAFRQATEQYGHGLIQFTAANAPEAPQVEDQWRATRRSCPIAPTAKIKLVSFTCQRESYEWSNSCEPFFGVGGSSDLVAQTTYRSQVFRDVDRGETHNFDRDAYAFDGPFDKAIMVEVEIWEKDQGDGWDSLSNALQQIGLACLEGACEVAIQSPPAAAIVVLAGIAMSILAGVFGACHDDFQINQSVTWDENALWAVAGREVTVSYDPGGRPGAFDIKFGITASNQPFPTPGVYYRLINPNSDKVAAVPGGSTADGTGIIQWASLGTREQQWEFRSAGGYYRIVNRNSGKLLHASDDGRSIIQRSSNGSQNQDWTVTLDGGYCRITNRHSGKVWDIEGSSTANGAAILQWNSTGGPNQQWQVVPVY